jgi:DNA ligase (NAD+)
MVGAPFEGLSFLFTGTLVALKRAAAQKQVVARGGTAASGVSGALSYLVVGAAGKAGSKVTKAEKAGVPVITEARFLEMLAEAEG